MQKLYKCQSYISIITHLYWLSIILVDNVLVANGQMANLPPFFISGSGDMSRFSLAENTVIGTPVYQLKGFDPEGSRLKYSISGPIFSVDRDTGVVRLRQELDRENQDIVEVIISITDGDYGTEPNTISLRREIPIRDYNDNQPLFINRPYLISVNESLPLGSYLDIQPPIIVLDYDSGQNAEITLTCVEEIDICEIFEIRAERLNEGNYTVQVILRKSLDFETRPNYIINISASDGAFQNRLTSFATIAINVIDIQDQLPIFAFAPYSANVDENTSSGIDILTISAIDGDISIPRDIYLSLIDEKFGYFELVPLNGRKKDGVTAILRTTQIPLDRENIEILENGGIYIFSVKATELIDGLLSNDTAITQITIVVNDIDDNFPIFSGDIFNISIPENLKNHMPLPNLSVFVDDIDIGANSHYSLKLRNIRNALGIFNVNPIIGQGRTPIVIKVSNSSRLDYDVDDPKQKQFSFDIVALVDDEEKSSTRINVELNDVNDNSPIFDKNMYQFWALENLTTHSVIGMVRATDKDSGLFGTINYRLKGFGVDYFVADQQTGGLYIKKKLDYEKQNSYSLTMVAEDGGGLEANVQVFVIVIDVNDNYPQFEYQEYTRTIREGANIFEPQFKVRANDLDGPTQGGGKVYYSIVSENSISGNVFRIDKSSGEITLQKIARSMDTERGEYELTVSATDFGIPPLNNTTKVYVRVGISGNQRPIFKGHFQNIENVPVLGPPSYRVSIPENAPVGYNVTTVTAHDPDGLDELLHYRIVGANDNFQINEKSGLITVSPQARIDRDSNMDSFEITINAVDSGLPIPETATTTVYVNVKDVNDEKPKFEQSSYIAYVSERANSGQHVIKVRAIDKDLNSKLQYSIRDNVRLTTKAGISITNRTNYKVTKAFGIDSETGVVYVNGKLSHDIAAVIVLPVEVRDLNAEVHPNEQYDITELTIYIQSFKDTNPVFINKGWRSSNPIVNIYIMEEMPIESTLFTLKAEDPVTKLPIQSFQLLDPKELEYFYVHERSGEVILRKRLDYETLKADEAHMKFNVKAISADGLRSTITIINVTIENVNDNSPLFDEKTYYTTVIENKPHSHKVIRVHATDKDALLTARDERLGYHKIVYSLYGEHANFFEINNETGDIQIAADQIIDRERTPHIHLQIKAEDSPGRPTDSKYSLVDLHIDILDMNDNAPQFNQNEYTAVIAENVDIDTFVLKVFAYDIDDGANGEVTYEIDEEDGKVYDLFKINLYTGEILTKRELTGKGRAQPYHIQVRAQDNGDKIPKQKSLSSNAKVTLYIGDVSTNDGLPYFIEPKIGQSASIMENAPVGSFVFQVKASDPDHTDTPSGTLYYYILDDTMDAKHFQIDENLGLITTTMPLDRETKDMYNIILEVCDDGQPRQSITRILQIRVLDVDDHIPVFIRDIDDRPLFFNLLEEEPAGTIVGNITAIDGDIGKNAAIDYIIINGNENGVFQIERTENNTAIIRTTQPIDRELISVYSIVVKCMKFINDTNTVISDSYDKYDKYDFSQLLINITILDVDDNLPLFEYNDSSLGIRINMPIDTVITIIRVTDRDAEALPITLSIENLTFVPQFYKRTMKISTMIFQNLFILNNLTGELRVGGSFSDYVDGYFQLKIRANNSMETNRHTFSTLRVFIIRDKSLLKFVFARSPNETAIKNIFETFQKKIKEKLKHLGFDLYILDLKMLTKSDYNIDQTDISSCFQMFQNGTAISMNEMQKLVDSERLKRELFDTYVEYGISAVEPCAMRIVQANVNIMNLPGTWLVIIAAFIGLAAIITAFTAYCLKKKYRKESKRSLQASRATTESYGVTVPTVYLPYCEPMYGPL